MVEIPLAPYLWLPCKGCNEITRHIIQNSESYEEKMIYRCCYLNGCGVEGGEMIITKHSYSFFKGCCIGESDKRMVLEKKKFIYKKPY